MASTIEIKTQPLVEPNVDTIVEVLVKHNAENPVSVRLTAHHESGLEVTVDSPELREREFMETLTISLPKAGEYKFVAQLIERGKQVASTTSNVRAGYFANARSIGGGGGGAAASRTPQVVPVTLQRSTVPQTEDEVLWMAIRHSTANLSFASYSRFMERQLCPADERDGGSEVPRTDEDAVADRYLKARPSVDALAARRALPFPGVDGYRWLKVATEVFVMASCGVIPRFHRRDLDDAERRMGKPVFNNPDEANEALEAYLGVPPNSKGEETLPYFDIIADKLQGQRMLRPMANKPDDGKIEACYGVLEKKMRFPCMIELIWSYWHEEGMLVQSMNAISQRFQNRRAPGDRDPLAQLEIDPLRPLNNLLWGYIQDEQHRLTVLRRAHEYDHHYGITLHGKAVAALRSADSRSKFLESFHNLLYKCTQFYKQDDDATVVADGFPVLNAIKETHYLLAQGAHNQFGDLPSTARQEMLMQQWLLARPEMREFLGGRIMVPHPEPWMDRVDAMKALQGWTDTGAVHFHDLGAFGEQVLLSIRYGAWSLINSRDYAANWARSWRTEIQGYIHAYRAVTGVDLAADPSSVRNTEERYLPPSVHLRNRLASQRRR